jgi:hypothetical protein
MRVSSGTRGSIQPHLAGRLPPPNAGRLQSYLRDIHRPERSSVTRRRRRLLSRRSAIETRRRRAPPRLSSLMIEAFLEARLRRQGRALPRAGRARQGSSRGASSSAPARGPRLGVVRLVLEADDLPVTHLEDVLEAGVELGTALVLALEATSNDNTITFVTELAGLDRVLVEVRLDRPENLAGDSVRPVERAGELPRPTAATRSRGSQGLTAAAMRRRANSPDSELLGCRWAPAADPSLPAASFCSSRSGR